MNRMAASGPPRSSKFMLSLRRKFSLSSPSTAAVTPVEEPNNSVLCSAGFTEPCLASTQPVHQHEVWRAVSPDNLPKAAVLGVNTPTQLACAPFVTQTGPGDGFKAVDVWADCIRWSNEGKLMKVDLSPPAEPDSTEKPNFILQEGDNAFGRTISLYEQVHPSGRLAGEPNADCFFVRTRKDSAFLGVADGVNWGETSMRAARAAIRAALIQLECDFFPVDKSLFPSAVRNTKEAARVLFRCMTMAHENVVKFTCGLTTLCLAVVLPLASHASSFDTFGNLATSANSSSNDTISIESQAASDEFALVLASVGDCQAFVISEHHGIREVTGWVPADGASGDQPARDFRDAGGALGPVHEDGSPELRNLMCAVTKCYTGDIVLLGSDGLIDNFDPVIRKIAVPESPILAFVDELAEEADTSLVDSTPAKPASNTSSPLFSIWPKPPLPPSATTFSSATECAKADAGRGGLQEEISALSLNVGARLELSWPERRLYAAKEIERVWHELNMRKTKTEVCTAREYCLALLAEVCQVTKARREFLQQPSSMRTRRTERRRRAMRLRKEEEEAAAAASDGEDFQFQCELGQFHDKLSQLPGKLDHATALVYSVGLSPQSVEAPAN